ncbi:MAG: heavy-metal-associated domain-containing protein [Nanoarchaeota archaeon]|nr:heavy-metal-associated domain-containing protein [Nanoarchaeota archaeon]
MAEKEYIEVNIRILIIGLISGVIASLWAVFPFFVSGVGNLLYVTVALGIFFLLMFGEFNKKTLIKSGSLALGIFLLISYVAVPFASGLLVSDTIDTSQYNNGSYAKINLALPGLFCGGCAYSSENALKGTLGVMDARVDFDSKSGVVVYDPSIVTPEELVSNSLIQAYDGEIIG